MPILTVGLVIICAGVLLWLVQRFIPMDATMQRLLQAVVVIAVVLWLLKVLGILDSLSAVTV